MVAPDDLDLVRVERSPASRLVGIIAAPGPVRNPSEIVAVELAAAPAARDRYLPAERGEDDLDPFEIDRMGRGGAEARPVLAARSQSTSSTAIAVASPPPMHRLATPFFP